MCKCLLSVLRVMCIPDNISSLSKISLRVLISGVLVLVSGTANAMPPLVHPYDLEIVYTEQLKNELLVVLELNAIEHDNPNWDDFAELMNVDTVDNAPYAKTADDFLFSYVDSPDLVRFPQKIETKDLPFLINVYLYPEQNGFGRSTLTVNLMFNNMPVRINKDLFFNKQRGKIKLMDGATWDNRTKKTERISVFRDNKRFEEVVEIGEGDDDESFQNIDPKSVGVAVVEHEPIGFNAVAQNHDDCLNPEKDNKIDRKLSANLAPVTLKYCVKLRYIDDYTDCPTGTHTNGLTQWGPKCDGSKQVAQGFVVELWDRDGETNDDYIATINLDYGNPSNNYACYTFEWDQSATCEDYPDIYVKTHYLARGSNSQNLYTKVVPPPGNGDKYTRSWRSRYYSNCTDSETCYSKSLNFSSSATDFGNRKAMILRSTQRFAQAWGTMTNITHHTIYYEFRSGGGIVAIGPDRVKFDRNEYDNWQSAAHEGGHCLQRQFFEAEGYAGQACPRPHYFTAPSNEACATREGWASFVAVAAYWNPENTNSDPFIYGAAIEDAEPLDTAGCTASTSTNEDIEAQVTKAFWDLIDANNEGNTVPATKDDELNTGKQKLCNAWDDFPDGTGNHEDQEPGETMNMYDFQYHLYDYVNDDKLDNTIDHNCIDQSTN